MKPRQHALSSGIRFAQLLVFAVVVSGCKSPVLHIQGGGFRNMTDQPIKNVTLQVVGTGRQVACSYIAPQGFFGTRIPLRAYEENRVEVSWTYLGRDFKSGPFLVPVPDPIPDEPVVFVVRFHPSGQTTSAFIPLSEIPPRYTR